MKVAVVISWVPFLRGGAEAHAEGLVDKLREYGHQAMLVKIPFTWDPPQKILEHMLACRSLRLHNVDRMIGMKFPAYYLPHPSKVLWLIHQFRQAYDLWGTPYEGLSSTTEGRRVREAIVRSDNRYLSECRRIYTNSPVVSERLRKFNGIASEVLYHPLPGTAQFSCGPFGDYVFCPGRINASKRQHLVVESMRYTASGVRLVVAGKPESQADLERLESLVRKHRLEDRVRLIPRFISEEEKAGFYAASLACACPPYDEDSYGYVTLEAYHSRKPVITCTDSGGTGVLVHDGATGIVVPPDPRALAGAMDRLYCDRAAARRMGAAGYERVLSLKITWDRVVECLTA